MGLTAIGMVGLIGRLGYVIATRHDPVTGDGLYHYLGANLLVDGKGWVVPLGTKTAADAHHPPVWRLVLAAPSLLGLRTIFEHQVLLALIGTATVVVVGFAGRRIAGPRVGLIAAGVAAFYPGLWSYEREMLSETGLLLGVAVVILVVYRYIDRPTLGRAVAIGLVCGVLMLTRSEQAFLLVLLLAPVILLTKPVAIRVRVGWLALAGAAAIVLVVPWFVFNLGRFKEPVLLSTNLGPTMIDANCPETYSGDLLGSYDVICGLRTRGPYLADQSEDDRVSRSDALEFVRHHLGQQPVVVAAREGRSFGVFRPAQEVSMDSHFTSTRPGVVWALMVSYWVLVPLGIGGAVLLRQRKVPVYPLMSFVVTVAVATAVTFGQTRYRAAIEVPLVLLAAVTLDWLWAQFSRRSADRRPLRSIAAPGSSR